MYCAVITYNVVLFGLLIAAMYVSLCAHAAARAGRAGLSMRKWFVLSLLLTPIPTTVVLWRIHVESLGESQRGRFRRVLASGRRRDGGAKRKPHSGDTGSPARRGASPRPCPHCGCPLPGEDVAEPAARRKCPRCGMATDQDHLA